MKQIETHRRSIFFLKFLTILLLLGNKTIAQPIANFTIGSSPSGCAPLTVNFKDLSSGNPTNWKWDLGNSTLSTQQNPTTTYFTPGVYSVTLTATNNGGSNSITKTQYITVFEQPTVNFKASDSIACFPISISFTDLSSVGSGTIVSREWDFGDGAKSTLQNPVHAYTAAGNYSVTLKITNSNGCIKTLTKAKYIQVPQKVNAGFITSAPTLCNPPETINFTNNTTGPGTINYSWNFGDGSLSTTKSPSHIYTNGGSYSVTLIAKSNLGCSDTITKNNIITIKDVKSNFTGPDSICVGSVANFINTSLPAPVNASWNFGDGSTSTTLNPTKIWNTPGTFTVKLTNNYGSCSNTTSKTIVVNANPIANFAANDSIGCSAPMTVNFQDLSAGSTKWLWDFGDGNTSTQKNPVYTYTDYGEFTVTLTITNVHGCTNTFIKNQYIKIVKPILILKPGLTEGCIPFSFKPTATASSIDGIKNYLWDFGDGNTSTIATPTNTYPNQGTYQVSLTVTTIDGCTITETLTDSLRTGTLPTANFITSTLTACAGSDIEFTDQSVPADKWLWNFGDGNSSNEQSPIKAYNDTGYFSIMLSAWNNGCSTTITKNKLVKIFPSVSKFAPQYDCVNRLHVTFKDKSILAQSWFWDFGDGQTSTLSNPEHTYTALGNYKVSLTTTNGSCSHTTTNNILLIDEKALTFTKNVDSVCRATIITFYAKGINTANISTYQWHWGDGTVDNVTKSVTTHSYPKLGTYSVKLVNTDLHGCKDSLEIPNYVYVVGPTSGFSPSAITGCKGNTINFQDESIPDPNIPIKTWKWNYGDGAVETLTSGPFSHKFNSAGNFSTILNVTDVRGCSNSYIIPTTIFITDPKAKFVSANTQICIGDKLAFTNNSTGSFLIYAWDMGNNYTSDQKDPETTYSNAGEYSVKLVVTDINGCMDSSVLNKYIKVKTPKASFTVKDSVSSCTPFEVAFTNTSENSVSQVWDFGDGNTSTLLNPTYYYTVPGTYTVTLYTTGAGGCVDSFKHNITLHPSTANLSYATTAGCSAMTVDLHVATAGIFSYFWDLGDGNTLTTNTPDLSYTYTLADSYIPKVILNDPTGCEIPLKGIDTIKLTGINVAFTADKTTICYGSNAQFTDASTSNGTITNYKWDFGDGTNSTDKNPVHVYPSTGYYTVQLIVQTAEGCSDTLIKTDYIKVATIPNATISGNTNSCGPTTFNFDGSLLTADTSALQWQWNFGNTKTTVSTKPEPQSFYANNDFTLELTVTNSDGCAQILQQYVSVHPIPEVNAGKDTTICIGQPANLHVKGTGETYEWIPFADLDCSSCTDVISTTTASTMYKVKAITVYGCENEDSIFIKVNTPLPLIVSPAKDSLCIGEKIQLTASGSEVYTWSPATGLSNAFIADPIASPTTSTIYTVTGSDTEKCFKNTKTVNISVFNYPEVNAGVNQNIIFGSTVPLKPIYSADVVKWEWTPATDLNCYNCPNPTATPKSSAAYTIKVTNKGGCSASDNVSLFVPCDANNVFIPNTFSPNGDGMNDVFYPMGRGIFRVQAFKIFNRWGQTVYYRNNFLPNDAKYGWNGTYNGKAALADVYTYIVEIVCSDNTISTFNGTISLLR